MSIGNDGEASPLPSELLISVTSSPATPEARGVIHSAAFFVDTQIILLSFQR